jgi:hypothetical protein
LIISYQRANLTQHTLAVAIDKVLRHLGCTLMPEYFGSISLHTSETISPNLPNPVKVSEYFRLCKLTGLPTQTSLVAGNHILALLEIFSANLAQDKGCLVIKGGVMPREGSYDHLIPELDTHRIDELFSDDL